MSIQSDELVSFTQQFANLINAGIPLSNALLALQEQEENRELREIISQVSQSVQGGSLLSEALLKHPRVFSRFFTSMVYAGEQGAGLPKVLTNIADHLEKESALKAKVRGVFTYPLVIGFLVLLIVGFLIVVVAPVFAGVYRQLRVALPWPTQLLLTISFGIRHYWWVLALLSSGIFYGCRRMSSLAAGREFLDETLLKLPFIGKFLHKVVVANFVRGLGDMLSCGVPIIDALDIVARVVGNRNISKEIKQMKSSIQAGGRLTETLGRSNVFPPIVVQMAYAGEESGSLGEMFGKCANTLEQDVAASARRLIVILEPSLTLILAGIVGFIAVAIYLPMFDLVRLVSQ
ncbi:hypothetical protein A3H38_03375 [candidate division WOR-1 bacterium RIFCSPLOWO2_02_FULL_46_20]|uniref:Type II secretion system protein GspF domain-containing protein n=2 Tax=Saganbacteria TaxID=1703751 RepID=A0A1F4RGD5_UNCSA|nr:MAG: hypothetical protein A3J44_06920 [candidate division WOR-1 bacterium RIFCSPHIGHO2_02_FULL_45_12]OGC07230.1 MAG: hypothetical protein A3H38_03375 [candidate division WOR-1 bacterium RIFCSPLOWO2_02_FULL_46_20]OGC10010.1 MAG: hypothetical protein A3F86_03775 [candidate division WOR-1 bacterium RIFCSPLOWO2_12_FULL_45_9]